MNRDIRLSVEFWRHPKTKKLVRRTGLEGVRSLQILWLWAVVNRPDGDLTGMDDESIELAADWDGEEGKLASTLVDVAFLDGSTGSHSLHGWLEYNAWQTGDSDRANTGRFNVLKSKMKDVHAKLPAAGITSLTKTDYEELKVPSRTQAVVDRLLEAASGASKACSEETTSTPEARPEAGLQGATSILQVDSSKSLQSPCPSPSPSPSLLGSDTNCASGDAPEAQPKPRRTSVLSGWKLETFNAFWKAYGWMKGRGGAEKAWAAIPNLDKTLVAQICEAARKEAAQRQSILDAGRTPKWAQGWLNERRWEDDYSQPEQQAHRPYVPQGRQGQYAGMTWDEIRREKNKQACLDATREYLAEKGIAMEEEEYGQADDEPWTVTVDE